MTAMTLAETRKRPPHVHCEECLIREDIILALAGRVEQTLMECRRLDERLGNEHAKERDERRRAEPLG